MSHHHHGFTFIELLVVIGLTALLFSVGIPSFASISERAYSGGISRQLFAQVNFARSTAVSLNRVITLCASDDGIVCNKYGSNHLLVFSDDNNNRQRDEDEVIYTHTQIPGDGALVFAVSRGAHYMRFEPDGRAIEFGHITYCPASGSAHNAQSVIISFSGRPRMARDRNSDGIREDANGRNISC